MTKQSELPRISEAEWEVMKVVWDEAPVTASQVVERLAGAHEWNHRTVKTMLNRLVKKGALAFEQEGRRYLYRAKATREQCVRQEGRSFLDRVFNGEPGSMLVHFVENEKLTEADIESLKRLLDRLEG